MQGVKESFAYLMLSNGFVVMQAIYHGKPIVGMPFFGDQPSNADRVVAKVSSFAQGLSYEREHEHSPGKTSMNTKCCSLISCLLGQDTAKLCKQAAHYRLTANLKPSQKGVEFRGHQLQWAASRGKCLSPRLQ